MNELAETFEPGPSEQRWLSERFRQRAAWMLLLVFVFLVVGAFWYSAPQADFRTSFDREMVGSWGKIYKTLIAEIFLNPWFYFVIAVVLALEKLIPARRQSVLSTGLRQDLWWVPFTLVARATVLPLYIVMLGFLYDRHLSFLTIHWVEHWPWLARVLFALLIGDFLFWASHYARHKLRGLWYFHAVHHAQKEMNFFTEYRVHPVDDVFLWTLGFIPLFMVKQSFASILAIVWLRHWHTRLYHSNIRSNFGLLRYILVTPQSHRIHHSIEARHRDTNFGLTFSIWDHLFGTQYRDYEDYPETGIPDGDFPFEQDGMRLKGLGNLIEQLLYPFKAVVREPRSEEAAGDPAGSGIEAQLGHDP